MMTSQLQDLLARVEATTGPDRELDAAIGFALKWFAQGHDCFHWIEQDGTYVQSVNPKTFTASLDSAMALCERVLPGWIVKLDIEPDQTFASVYWHSSSQKVGRAEAKTPALALLAALLKALIAKETE